MPGGMRAGWVPCVGFQPIKPSVVMIEETDNPIAEECERAFKRIREAYPECDGTTAAGPGSGFETLDDEPTRAPEKPPMKLLMSSRGVQDFHQVQEHYQNLMNQAPQSPEVGKFVTEMASPTGKGAELFAKRKKRMDKFIVDETTVQKSQQTSLSQQSFSSSSTTSSFNSISASSQNVSSQTVSNKKQAEIERNKQQDKIMDEFIKHRDSSFIMVKSPWAAALETGNVDDAFVDKRQRFQGKPNTPGSNETPKVNGDVVKI